MNVRVLVILPSCIGLYKTTYIYLELDIYLGLVVRVLARVVVRVV